MLRNTTNNCKTNCWLCSKMLQNTLWRLNISVSYNPLAPHNPKPQPTGAEGPGLGASCWWFYPALELLDGAQYRSRHFAVLIFQQLPRHLCPPSTAKCEKFIKIQEALERGKKKQPPIFLQLKVEPCVKFLPPEWLFVKHPCFFENEAC